MKNSKQHGSKVDTQSIPVFCVSWTAGMTTNIMSDKSGRLEKSLNLARITFSLTLSLNQTKYCFFPYISNQE